MTSTRTRVLAALLAASVVACAGSSWAGDTLRTRYEYDRAGRLIEVRHDEGSGRAVRELYDYDAAGNLSTRRTSRGRDFGVAAQRPRAGVWFLTVWEDGAVTGLGADAGKPPFDLIGSLTLDPKTAKGSIVLLDEATGATASQFAVSKAPVKRTKAGDPQVITLRPSKPGSGTLLATATALRSTPSGFSGNYGSRQNQVTVGTKKKKVGAVVFTPVPYRPGTSTLSGALTGTLVRGPGNVAFGQVTYDGVAHLVTGVLKKGAAAVTATSTKGPKFQISLKR